MSGYMGGAKPNPTYEQVCGGNTGHVEVVQLKFDPAVITYREVLEIFFATHDPTTLNRQGNDVGNAIPVGDFLLFTRAKGDCRGSDPRVKRRERHSRIRS